jgi:plastocyanin
VRRIPSLFLSLVALAGLLAACGSDNNDASSAGLGSNSGAESSTTTMASEGGGAHDGGEMDHGMNTPVAADARPIDVSGSSFEFSPAQITVKAGEDIAIVLTSTDIQHDLTVESLDTHVSAKVGETAQGGLRADQPGRYAYYCTVSGHREAGMEGTLIVEAS